RIGATVLEADNAGSGADVDDVARSLLAHHRKDRTHDMRYAAEVCGELGLDLGQRHFFEVTEQAVSRVVDGDVDAAEPRHRFGDASLHLRFAGHVQLDKGKVIAGDIAQSLAGL